MEMENVADTDDHVTWSLGWLAVAGSVWSHPVPVVLDNLFVISNLLFVLFPVTIMSFGDDILEYLQFKFRLITSIEIELKQKPHIQQP